MSFPADLLDIRIRIALEADRSADWDTWTWTDISEYGREAGRIVISQGDADEFGETPPATCELTLDNTDGRFSRRNPLGPYFGQLRLYTPIWIEVDAGSGYVTRFVGETGAWPKRWDRSGNDATVKLQCAGVSRRLGQNTATSASALTWYLPSTNPVAWWPLEDGADSTLAASGLPGGNPMLVKSGVMDFTSDAPPGASGSAHPDPSAVNALIGEIEDASTIAWQVSIWSKGEVESPGSDAFYVAWEIITSTGQVLRCAFQHEIDEAIGVAQWTGLDEVTPAHNIVLDDPAPHANPGITGQWIHVTFSIEQSGADCNVYLNIDEVEVASEVWSSLTIGAPIRVRAISPFGAGQPTSQNVSGIWLSHLTIHNGVSLITQQQAGMGWPGELAGDRFLRLCAEAGVPHLVLVGTSDTEPMGPQETGALMPLLRDCETVDGGTVEDDPNSPALLFIPRSARYNLPYYLDLDVADADVGAEPEATDDDQATVNQVTVSRPGGSSATARDEADIAAGGGLVLADSQTRNLANDDQLLNHAGWLLHLGQVDEDRWPKITLNFARRPELIADWLTVVPGAARARIAGLPDQPGPVDVMIEGYTETISQVMWTADMFCAPASPWDVAEADGEQRVAADGSVLADNLTSSGTTMLLASTVDNGPWLVGDSSSHPDDFPLDIRIGGGEIATASEIAPSVVDTYARSTSNGFGTPTTSYLGTAWTVEGTASAYSTTGTVARIAASAVGTLYTAHVNIGEPNGSVRGRVVIPVVPSGGSITARVQGRFASTGNLLEAQITVNTNGLVTLQLFRRVAGSGSVVPGATLAAVGTHNAGNAWMIHLAYWGEQVVARAWNDVTGVDPGHWQVAGEDDAVPDDTRAGIAVRRETGNTNNINVDWTLFEVLSPQVVSLSARGVTGVQRAWSAGAEVDVRYPAIVPL